MSRLTSALMLLALTLTSISVPLFAQSPTGIIQGTVTDASGAVVPNASVTITNKATGIARDVRANAAGLYGAPALNAGDYEIKVVVTGFKSVVQNATVTAGGDVQVNVTLSLGNQSDVVTVEAAASAINYESNTIQGDIQRETIQDLPLNGRSFVQLASLEPGVTIGTGSVAQFNTLFTVSVLGSGNRTVFTIDGGNISDNIDTAGGIPSMNFSQDMVQEFQLSSNNFDLSTPVSAGGAINIVSRSGSNDFHGSAYFFYRDHNIAAYPNLARPSQANQPQSPFFARRNPGIWVGGPIKKDKLFFFANFENFNQAAAIGVFSTAASSQLLQGDFTSPYHGKQLSLRLDYHLNEKNNIFLRYSHDGNNGFGQSLEFGDPSNWAHNRNWADQYITGLTTTLTPTIVNDLRVQYNYWNNHNSPAQPGDCTAPCVAGVLPNIFFFNGSNQSAIGPNFNAPQGRNTRRYEAVDTLSWQKGSHRIRFGADLNLTASNGYWGFCTPLCTAAFSADFVRNALGPLTSTFFPNLPTVMTSDASVLNLPVLNLNSSIFSGVGVGNVSTPGPYDYAQNTHYNQYRAFIQDTWKLKPNFTLNYGLAWNAQTGFYNSDLSKPAYLTPIVGASNLGPTQNNVREFQPAVGFTWSPFKNNKTVIRGGAGLYWDSTPGYYKLRDAAAEGPPGDGRSTLAASAFTNNLTSPLINLGTGQPIPFGAPLPLNALTTMTVGQFANLVSQELPLISATLAPSNPPTSGAFPFSEIDYAKQGVEIYPHSFPLARSYQANLGIQRELPYGLVVTADYTMRVGINVSFGEVDQNLFNRFLGTPVPQPVIPNCNSNNPATNLPFQKSANGTYFLPGQECSTGTITFWDDQGRSTYNGLLMKVQKRYSNRTFLQVSYAYQHASTDVVNVWNDSNLEAGWGQYLAHQNLNLSGYVNLPWGFQFSLNSSMISATPTTVSVSGLDLPGTTPSGSSEPLPGLPIGCVNNGCGMAQIQAAVTAYNNTIAGQPSAKGPSSLNPKVQLPPNFSLGKPVISQDIRITKTFSYKERYKLAISADVFNVLNIANLSSPTLTLDPAGSTVFSFGQYTSRIGQSLGQGGPRAFQFGGRFSF
jgi:hypothetical protein